MLNGKLSIQHLALNISLLFNLGNLNHIGVQVQVDRSAAGIHHHIAWKKKSSFF